MSIRLNLDLVEKATIMGKALNRTTLKQIEHWAKICEMTEDNPDFPAKMLNAPVSMCLNEQSERA
ncbi:TA system antitoxin ParD family protein [Alteromonas oceanisediminis]